MRHIPKSYPAPEALSVAPPEDASVIRRGVYAAPEVKRRLRADQHGKCAYCECRLNGDYGSVEHFRPKSGYATESQPSAIQTPGYHRLAYSWDNLLLSCSTCNSSFKRNNFALADESRRAVPGDDVSGESPLLINPAAESPQDFLTVHRHVAAPKPGLTEADRRRADYTISILGLNSRPDLLENRLRVMASHENAGRVRRIAFALLGKTPDIQFDATLLLALADERLARLESPEAEYSAMFINEDGGVSTEY